MNNTEENRQQVRAGLDRRAQERKAADAELEKQARKLRIIINQNHIEKTHEENPEHIRTQDTGDNWNRRRKEREERHREAEECKSWYIFLFHVFAPLLIASIAFRLLTALNSPIIITVSATAVACLFAIGVFASAFID